MNTEMKKYDVPVDISIWWDSLNDLQQQNLCNLVFNKLHDQWEKVSDFKLDEYDKKVLYFFNKCL